MEDHIVTIVLAVIGSAGFWSFVSMREKSKAAATTAYQDTLKAQVDRLADKLERYTTDKEELLREIAMLRAELAEAHATIKHLQELLSR